jgi:hypothetical protein
VVAAFPDGWKSFAAPRAKAEQVFMLPGFRFVFAAIALSVSILVFSLGAAALLRAAHQEFASMPRLIAAETVFAQRNEAEPALAMLRDDPTEAYVSEAPTADDMQIPAAPAEPSDPASSDHAAPEAEKLAVSDDAAMQASALPNEPEPEAPAPAETKAESPAPVEQDIAAVDGVTPIAAPSTANPPAPAAAVTDDSTTIAMTRIATLGGPAVNIGPPAKVKQRRAPKKHPAAAVEKLAPKQQAVTRPKMAPRPRIARAGSRPSAAPSAAPFGSWDNRWPGSGPAGNSAFRF